MTRPDRLLFAAIVVASCAWCLTSSRQLGATFDEPFYLESGMDAWRHGHFARLLAAGTMPLPAHLQTLPVYIGERSSGQVVSIDHDLTLMLQWSRPVTLAFWIVLLFFTMQLGRIFGGVWGGRIALLLIGLEPNFLAHASLATTDIPLAACFTAFVVHFLTGRDSSVWMRVVVPGIWFALALASKVSALALAPFAVVIAAWPHLRDRDALRRVIVDAMVVIAIGVLFATIYCGTGGQTWLHGTLERMAPDDAMRPLVSWIGATPLFPNAFYAIWFQFAHNQTGQATFLAGLESARGLWFFAPLLMSIKLTAPFLVAVAVALWAGRAPLRAAAGAIAGLIVVMLLFRVQTGIRFFLPLLALTIAWTGSRLAMLLERQRRWAIAALTVLSVGMAVDAAMIWPDGLRFVNGFWGGAENGYRVVSDSNYDWGQGLPELDAWRRTHDLPLAVWYFGTDTRFPELVRYEPRRDGLTSPLLAGRQLAVSTSLLFGGYVSGPGPGRELVERLRAATPVARTSTFLIFEMAPR